MRMCKANESSSLCDDSIYKLSTCLTYGRFTLERMEWLIESPRISRAFQYFHILWPSIINFENIGKRTPSTYLVRCYLRCMVLWILSCYGSCIDWYQNTVFEFHCQDFNLVTTCGTTWIGLSLAQHKRRVAMKLEYFVELRNIWNV